MTETLTDQKSLFETKQETTAKKAEADDADADNTDSVDIDADAEADGIDGHVQDELDLNKLRYKALWNKVSRSLDLERFPASFKFNLRVRDDEDRLFYKNGIYTLCFVKGREDASYDAVNNEWLLIDFVKELNKEFYRTFIYSLSAEIDAEAPDFMPDEEQKRSMPENISEMPIQLRLFYGSMKEIKAGGFNQKADKRLKVTAADESSDTPAKDKPKGPYNDEIMKVIMRLRAEDPKLKINDKRSAAKETLFGSYFIKESEE